MYGPMIIGFYKKFEDKAQSLYQSIREKVSFSFPTSGLELALGTNRGYNVQIKDSLSYILPVYFAKGKDGKKSKKPNKGGDQLDSSKRPRGVPRRKYLRLKYSLTNAQVKSREGREKKKKKT